MTFSELCSLFSDVYIFHYLCCLKNSEKEFKELTFPGRAELFHREYTVLYRIAELSGISESVLNTLRPSVSCSEESLQTMFDLLMSTFLGEESLKSENN